MEFAQSKRLRERADNIQSAEIYHCGSQAGGQNLLAQNVEIEQLCNLFAELPVAIIVINPNGIVSRANESAIAMLELQPVGVSWREIIEQCFKCHLDMGELAQLKNGRTIDIKTQPLSDHSGQVVLLSDITKQQYYQKIKERQQRLTLLGEMVASLAHQLRTPLSSSLLYLSQIENKTGSISGIMETVSKTKSSLHHLNRIIKDMILFAGGSQVDHKKIILEELINNIISDVSDLKDQTCVDLTISNISNVETLNGNPDAIRMMLVNFLVNSIQACKDKEYVGQKAQVNVIIRSNISNNKLKTIEFFIQDNGIGINQSNLDKIETPFFTTKKTGTGLGLSVARTIIESHQGSLSIKSMVNTGTEIRVAIPLLEDVNS